MSNAELISLPSGRQIRMVSAPYFLITKLEAFEGRGKGDYLLSHDIEDLIAVFDGRREIVDEVKDSAPGLSSEMARRLKEMLDDRRFVDAVFGHMPTDAVSQQRVDIIINKIRQIAELP